MMLALTPSSSSVPCGLQALHQILSFDGMYNPLANETKLQCTVFFLNDLRDDADFQYSAAKLSGIYLKGRRAPSQMFLSPWMIQACQFLPNSPLLPPN
jgi:hypothetical protein